MAFGNGVLRNIKALAADYDMLSLIHLLQRRIRPNGVVSVS